MTTATIPLDHRLPPADRPHTRNGWWAMALVCLTELSLFAYLIASYFYLGARSPSWPPPGIHPPKLLLPIVMTGVLLLSSGAMYWGEEGIKRGRRNQLAAGLVGTMLLGLGFLAIFAYEYRDKLRFEFRPQSHAYASLFYTITSFHAAHVLFGILLIGYTLVRSFAGHFSATERLGVAVTSLYWHFVGVVWLLIFTCLYLGPRLNG